MPKTAGVKRIWPAVGLAIVLNGAIMPALAQDAVVEPAARKAANGQSTVKSSLLGVIKGINPMLWPLGLCSIVALGYSLERMVALRRSRVIPHEFVSRFRERLAAGKLDRDRAAELCRANDSPVARVIGHVVRYWGQPASTIRQTLGYDAAGEVSELKRNIRVLNGSATIAPLLGLLGTVFGMIEAFDSFEARGAKAAAGSVKSVALAHGISVALISTAVGLGIAIVSMTAYYYLLNRVDVLVRDLDAEASGIIDIVSMEASRTGIDRDRRPLGGPSDLSRHGRAEPV